MVYGLLAKVCHQVKVGNENKTETANSICTKNGAEMLKSVKEVEL